MLAEGIIALLQQDAGVIAKAATRGDGKAAIFAGQAPEAAPMPLSVYGFAYEENLMTMDGPSAFTKARIEIWNQAEGYLDAKKLARAVKVCLENFQGTLSEGTEVDSIHRISEVDTFQDAPFLYLTATEYEVLFRDTGS
jgi:hypothetical protein